MIGIRIDRVHWLELYADTKLDITLTSPVFSDKVIEENSVYNFTVPNNPHNAGVFGFPGRAQRIDRAQVSFDAEIFMDASNIGRGTAYLTKITRKSYEIVVALDSSSFYSIYGKKLLNEFTYGTGTLFHIRDGEDALSFTHLADSVFPDVNYAYFPVQNIDLYKDTAWEAEYTSTGRTGYYSDAIARRYQNDYILIRPTGPEDPYYVPNVHTITPFPYVGHVLEEIFKEAGYSIKTNCFSSDDRLRRMCVYNPNVVINDYHDSLTHNIRVYTYNHVPHMKVIDFLSALSGMGISFVIDEKMKTVSIRLFKTDIVDSRKTMRHMFVDEEISKPKTIKYKNTVDSSDTYCSGILKPDDLEKMNYVGVFYTLTHLNDEYPSPVQGDLALIFSNQYFYLYDFDDDTSTWTWIKYAYNLQNRSVGDYEDTTDVTLGFTQLFCEYQDLATQYVAPYDADGWYVPSVHIEGNFLQVGMQASKDFNDFDLKLMFYWGFEQSTILNLPYPVGSSTVYRGGDGTGEGLLQTSPLPSLSLFPTHEFNFIDEFLDKITLTKSYGRVRNVKAIFTASDLRNVDWLETYLIDGRRWLITKLSISASHSGLSVADVELTEIF